MGVDGAEHREKAYLTCQRHGLFGSLTMLNKIASIHLGPRTFSGKGSNHRAPRKAESAVRPVPVGEEANPKTPTPFPLQIT